MYVNLHYGIAEEPQELEVIYREYDNFNSKVSSQYLDLDFDDISSNLKEYLKGQSTLKDYNFEGSNISLLIDLLAYSSHVSSFQCKHGCI